MAIRNPIEWGVDQLKVAASAVETTGRAFVGTDAALRAPLPEVRRIGVGDLRDALAKGIDDFAACRSDVVFLCLIYPALGLVLASLASGYGMLPLLFPLASGFALVGPFAAVGLYEMSRRREAPGAEAGWPDALSVARAPAFGKIVLLGLMLVVIFLLWLGTAEGIYALTLGPDEPTSLASFIHDVIATSAGWALIGVGCGVGFLFAVGVLMIATVSFPLLLDRDVALGAAIWTSVRAVSINAGTMALWGFIVAAGLVIGSIPLFLGLVVVMPVLGHATWHLYRKLLPPDIELSRNVTIGPT
jgi:uncharacterized membrane protein